MIEPEHPKLPIVRQGELLKWTGCLQMLFPSEHIHLAYLSYSVWVAS